MAFGNHDYETAVKLAAEKTKELGRNCVALPSEEEPDKFTIGIEIKATTVAELLASLKLKSATIQTVADDESGEE